MNVRAIWVVALVVGFTTGTACRDADNGNVVTEPVPWSPQNDHTQPDDYYQYCRMWSDGTTTRNVGGQHVGPCATTVAAVPKVYFTNQDTLPITFTFSSTVFDIDFGARFVGCTTTPMTWATFDAAGNPVESRTIEKTTNCTGTVTIGPMILAPFKSLRVTPPAPMPPNDPFSGKAITFQFDFFTLCPPTGDPVLADPNVREALRDALSASNPYSTDPSQRKEHGGIIWRLPDGAFYAQPIIDPVATACTYKASNGTFTPPDGATPVAGYHKHPNLPNHHVDHASCPSQVPPGAIGYGNPDFNGGAGNNDWNVATDQGFPTYVISPTGTVSRLDPNTPVSARPGNKNRWKWDPSHKCFIRMFA